MNDFEFNEDSQSALIVDFQELLLSGEFGSLDNRSNCWQILWFLGCPDQISGIHRQRMDPLILRYAGLQITLQNDHLNYISLSLENAIFDQLPISLSFVNFMSEEERHLQQVEQLLKSHIVTWEKNSTLSNEYFDYFLTDRKVDLVFDAETGILVDMGITYDYPYEDSDP